MPKLVTITHYHSETAPKPPGKALEFQQWLSDQLASIPEEYRASATIGIDAFEGYDNSASPEITIRYRRPETEGEIATREREEERSRRHLEECDRRAYQKLKARFESATPVDVAESINKQIRQGKL